MINIHHHPVTNDNDTNQSIEVTEVRYNGARQLEDRLINRCIVFTNNQYPVIFGQAEPLPAGGWKVVVIRYLINTVKCLGIVALFLLVLLGVIRLASNTSSSNLKVIPYDECESLIMKERIPCDCSNTTTKDESSINNNDEIFGPMPYDETDVKEIFDDTEVIDHSTCALYDLFLYVFNKLCSLKDDIIAIKLGSATDNSFVSKYDQNGAVPNEDNRPTNVTISLLNSSELFVERHTI